MGFLRNLFGDSSTREIKKINPIVQQIESLEPEMQELSPEQMKDKTAEFKARYQQGETLDALLPEAFALVREAAWRVLGMKPYPVQLMGGIILHQGRIAEMRTGEGKTLVATLPAYLNALAGKGVHIVTVNDYLAQRDRDWMGKIYEYLGLSVGVIVYGLDNAQRRENYGADITYGTNNQFGFDYLRDNMVIHKKNAVQRDLYYAIVDEVDSILVDEARTPLIISGEGDKSTDLYTQADRFTQGLTGRVLDPNEKTDLFDREMVVETVDYVLDEKRKTASLTEQGTEKAERFFGLDNLSDPDNMEYAHHINQALKARYGMHRDIDYVVRDDEVLIVDEFTGRIMQGRRYSDGLHQAIEAKEKVAVKSESRTLATITFQNYFRMYEKLAGMTGTAKTEEDEFREIYHMDVIEIPTNKPVNRTDKDDHVFSNSEAKFAAIVDEIAEVHSTGQPILVGTITIENSEHLSRLLSKKGVKHDVLNAKQHEREAEIVAQAGRLGSVTIATNMAGRGTDIILGGNPEFMAKNEMKKRGYEKEMIEMVDNFVQTDDADVEAARGIYRDLLKQFKVKTDEEAKEVIARGGLYILGTERHESRRIDNQLRGRSGRQGDPGESRFYISLTDDLMRLFGGDNVQRMIERYAGDEVIEGGMLTNVIERAQKKVESNNFSIRKHVLQYDDVMNKQRQVIYQERKRVLDGENMHESVMGMLEEIVEGGVLQYTQNSDDRSLWNLDGLSHYLQSAFMPKEILESIKETPQNRKDLTDTIIGASKAYYQERESRIGEETMREMERVIMLQVVDAKWMDHIDAMDQLRQGIGIRAYGQEDPVRAYANEGFQMFEEMNAAIQEDTLKYLFHVPIEKKEIKRKSQPKGVERAPQGNTGEKQQTIVKGKKIGPNDPCPCGSGKKYKKCHGKVV
ncbi:MAG: preprotein translocase subunit SecA [Peptoniphilaceae bacterium]|jgi:preprotein translocase subunit SecA|nr:preprotein translocase subunit SecA [Bacillota bacterium]